MKIKELVPLIDKVVADNVTLFTKDEIGRNYLLHVSREKIKNNLFIPRIAHSQGSSENRTFLRVNCAATLIDCINAIANLQKDFSDDWSPGAANKYYIYAIPFEYVLKPNTKLVYDADFTDEMWLFTYSDDSKDFHADLIGSFYVKEIHITPTKSDKFKLKGKPYIYNDKDVTFNCFSEKEINIDDNRTIKGHFSFTYNINREDKCKVLSSISTSEFEKNKVISSSLESFKNKPHWVRW